MDKNIKIEINRLKCKKCGHKWIPRQEVIVGCPKCKSGYYKARVIKRIKEGSEG
jgi:Zn finger protein HypA/HybF involved in hydrogenase expression